MKAALKKSRDGEGAVRIGYVLLVAVAVGLILLPLMGVLAVTSYIRLGADASALKNSAIAIAPAKARVVVNVGWLTTGVVRLVAGFFPLPPEAHMALRSVRAAEVGVYHLDCPLRALDRSQMLARTESAMRKRGWERIVGVSQDKDLVAVFLPKKISSTRVKCCVLVINDEDLVVVAARGNVDEVLRFASEKIDFKRQVPFPLLAGR